jgi:hypothetical protein
MSDNKKVRLDENNKLVIENDNAVITSEGTTSKIKGVYEISDEDVEKLLILLNNNTIQKKIISYSMLGCIYKPGSQSTKIFTSDEAVDEALSVVSKEYNELDKEYKELKDIYTTMKEKYDNLLANVKKHNKKRLFNKIKID